MASSQPHNMEYGFLSKNCGMKVSKICLGTMTFGHVEGSPLTTPEQADEDLAFKMLDRFIEVGGNFIDTSNMYNAGNSEEIIGKWLKSRGNRENVVIATKGFHPVNFMKPSPNSKGGSRKNLVCSLEGSLERLGVDYIDLYQMHAFDEGTPLRETLLTLNDFVRCGKVRYIGASNYSGRHLQKALMLADQLRLEPFVTLQNQYSLMVRDCEHDGFEVCREEGIGIMPFSPLHNGLLTEKYADKQQKDLIQNSRQAWYQALPWLKKFFGGSFEDVKGNPAYWELIDTLKDIGSKHGKNVSQVSLKWLIQRPSVTSVVIGVKTVKQLDENVVAGFNTWRLTDEQMKKIEEASEPFYHLPYPFGMSQQLNTDRDNV